MAYDIIAPFYKLIKTVLSSEMIADTVHLSFIVDLIENDIESLLSN